MRVSLNLATRPYADIGPALKRLRIAMGILAVIGIGLGLGLRAFHQKAEEARAAEQKAQAQIDAISREKLGYENMMKQPANVQLLNQSAALNKLFDEKTFSWTLAMEDLETVLPGGVQVTSIEPKRAKDGKITLNLRVVGPRNLADDLVQNLEHSRHFMMPHIIGESSETEGGPNTRMEPISASNRFQFELLADYNPVAPAERRAERKQTEAKPEAAGALLGQSTPPPFPMRSVARPAVPGQANSRVPGQPVQRNFPAAPGQMRPNPNLAKPNPGGQR
jgi:type IV pilus assembly protein PilN